MSEKREDGLTDREFWESFVEFFPPGWYLSGFTYRLVALYCCPDDSLVLTRTHTRIISNAYNLKKKRSKPICRVD